MGPSVYNRVPMCSFHFIHTTLSFLSLVFSRIKFFKFTLFFKTSSHAECLLQRQIRNLKGRCFQANILSAFMITCGEQQEGLLLHIPANRYSRLTTICFTVPSGVGRTHVLFYLVKK
jgi:hypothetical protein